MAHTLVVIRHAKSDWSQELPDHERPLAPRGRKQAPAIGRWLASSSAPPLDLAVVSTATRARKTWQLIADQLGTPPPVRESDDLYSVTSTTLRDVVAGLPAEVGQVAMVGHNPAIEELVEELTDHSVRMRTSAVAVITLEHWSSTRGTLELYGRPADGPGSPGPP